MKLWIIVYMALTIIDVLITYILISSGQFTTANEGNLLIRNLMEKYGVWQGLTIYVIQEFAIFFLMWICVYYILMRLIVNKGSEQLRYKIDIIIFNLVIPFIIMASALIHLGAIVLWIDIATDIVIIPSDYMRLFIYSTVICGIIQAFHVFKLTSTNPLPSDQSSISE